MTTVDEVFAYLTAQALVGGSTGWAVLRRRMMDAPATDQCVVVTEDGGGNPEMRASSGLGDAAMKDVGILITVRAAQWDSDASMNKASAIFVALHGLRSIALVAGGALYFRVQAMTPDPVFIGFDDKGRPLHTIAFRLLRFT